MKHQFYHIRMNDGRLTPSDSAALEAVQDHARQVFARTADSLAPPLPDHPEAAAHCLREWHGVLDDLSCAAAVATPSRDALPDQASGVTDISHRSEAPRLAFRIQSGVLALTRGHPWCARETPVFRSGEQAASAVLYSDLIALEAGYAVVELRASDEELRLNISGGGKNEPKIYISLYTNGRLIEKSLLGTELSWDLSGSEPGIYQLECGATPALSFQIQE